MGIMKTLMESLTATFSFDIFMGNYFTFVHLLTQLGVNNTQATSVPNKNRLHICKAIEKKQQTERGYFEQCIAHQVKKQCDLCGWLE